MPLPVDTLPCLDQLVQLDAHALTLAGFVRRNRAALLARCREKVTQRAAPASPPLSVSPGVTRFLEQLVEVLECEQSAGVLDGQGVDSPSGVGIGPAAALHGVTLRQYGYTVEQVVHEYGDVCQAVTELALEQQIPFSTDEFRILNRCLDNAIADAVTAYQSAAQQTVVDTQSSLLRRLHVLIHDHQRLVGIARHSFAAIKSGHVGITGATGTLLAHALEELIHLSDERLPKVVDALRQASD